MQKKMKAIIVLLLGTMLFFIFQNSSLKNENLTLVEQNEQLKNENVIEVETNEQAKEVANDFINGYFNYQDKPAKQDVESYATNEALGQLQFDGAEGLEEIYGDTDIEKIHSSVENLSIYEGQSLDDRVEVVALFDNRIEVNDLSSVAMTILTLEMIVEEDQWKVANFTFTQQ
ncbi:MULTISPECIES: hypothetical protein [Bacillaceae]|uniref:Uncharacterized protein n=1 Tax=Alkalicoccobacillus plakortidis TaxID=444060 RepID=A0A9D5I1U1_9BACI|nr:MULTISPECIES: hypothetical protein [Bacillaceae]KQL56976.1 hypothetical protein AN965_10970 [Alkalicoccobacillus plakortidis]